MRCEVWGVRYGAAGEAPFSRSHSFHFVVLYELHRKAQPFGKNQGADVGHNFPKDLISRHNDAQRPKTLLRQRGAALKEPVAAKASALLSSGAPPLSTAQILSGGFSVRYGRLPFAASCSSSANREYSGESSRLNSCRLAWLIGMSFWGPFSIL